MNSVDSNWKKYFKQTIMQKETLPVFIGIYTFINIISLALYFGITQTMPGWMFFLFTALVTVLLLSPDFIKDMKRFQEQEEEDDAYDECEEIVEKQESFYDMFLSIRMILEENVDSMTKCDQNFANEFERLLQDISYIENACTLSEKEEKEILIHMPMHWQDVLQTYFFIFPENREELANELLQKVQEQRKKLHTTYIQPHQNILIQQCKQKAKCMEEEKREYLYIQD